MAMKFYGPAEDLRTLKKKRVIDEATGCWNWTGSLEKLGYGYVTRKVGTHAKRTKVHRLSWTLFRGPIPDGLFVLHRCDNRRCMNPDHLFLGTQRDNVRDMDSKGRGNRPGLGMGFKLNADQVREIRQLRSEGVSVKKLAEWYGVTHTHLYKLFNGRCWNHVGP